MKNTKIKTYFAIKFTCVIITFGLLLLSCSIFGGFNRRTAAGLIEKDKRYTAPSTMTINIGARLTNAGADIAQKFDGETAEQAIPRVKEDFMQRHPQIIVAEQLGFIKLYFENGTLRKRPIGAPRFDDELGHWFFKARAEITDEGRKLWKDLNLSANEEYLPLAVRGTPEITGIQDESQNRKSADFKYKWEATELGKAFDPNNSEFKELPPNLQEALKKTQIDLFSSGGSNTLNFNSARMGRAFFQKYDDGWRISDMAFF